MTAFTKIPKHVEELLQKSDVTIRAGASSKARACWW